MILLFLNFPYFGYANRGEEMTKQTIFACLILLPVLFVSPVLAQTTTIQGKVTDKITGDPMVGVNITIADQMIGTITNEDGSFKLETQVAQPFTIIVSMMGFQNQEIEIESALSNLDIELEEQVYLGQEVVFSASRIS